MLGFLVRSLSGAAGVARGSITDMRLGVEVTIGALGLRSVGCRSCLVAGTR